MIHHSNLETSVSQDPSSESNILAYRASKLLLHAIRFLCDRLSASRQAIDRFNSYLFCKQANDLADTTRSRTLRDALASVCVVATLISVCCASEGKSQGAENGGDLHRGGDRLVLSVRELGC
jgi:hypothetical protein